MIVRATVEIEFEVPEGSPLDGAYVNVRATLCDRAGNEMADTMDCATKGVEVRFRQQAPRFLRERYTGDYVYDAGRVDPCGNHQCRYATGCGDPSSVVTSLIHADHIAKSCVEVGREDVPAEWLRHLNPQGAE